MEDKTAIFRARAFALSGLLFAGGLQAVAPATPASIEARMVEQAMQQHRLFAMLAEDKPDFRTEWEKRLRLRQQLAGNAVQEPEAIVQAGLDLAMGAARSYLMRASDAASNRFLASLAKVIAEGEKDPDVCLAYVESGIDDERNVSRNEKVEARLGKLLQADLVESLAAVVASGRNGEKRVLTREELPNAIHPVILAMAHRDGADALQGLGKVNDRRASPQERCRAMARMLAAFAEQPEQRRAMLARTLFSGALPRKE